MKINYLSVKEGTPASGYWDQTFIADLLEDLPEGDRVPFVIPGAYQGDSQSIAEINRHLSYASKAMVFITSDEEKKFPIEELSHPDMIVYGEYRNNKYGFPLGYTPDTRSILKEIGIPYKDTNWFFSGQITHSRRIDLFNHLMKLPKGILFRTEGFAQGLDKQQYMESMARSAAIPCPPGPISHDSFRTYEALESGSVPIVDSTSPSFETGYWQRLFPDAPFPILTEYSQIEGMIDQCQNPDYQNKVFAWWIAKKHEIKAKLSKELGCPQPLINVVVPTSPIKSHPSTEIIEQTIESVRFHHPDAPIYITIDGIRDEQLGLKDAYREYIHQLLWKCNFEWENVIPVYFDKHVHQSGMMKEVLKKVDSPLLLYVEHDTPLITDLPIDWEFISGKLMGGDANMIRFHYEAMIPKEHAYLMLSLPEDNLVKTYQWSQRPHLARTDFYNEIMKFFSPDANCFLEDLLYGQLVREFDARGMEAWNDWKVFIYHPDGPIKRSLNLDGRAGDVKYESEQIW